ncbi:MAG: aspartate 1-decarboxylase [Bdellovibrionales bacterium]|nr:aspartate 1-decarboxylase [Bdellovibrionales bacterium]
MPFDIGIYEMVEILKCKLHGVIATGADKDYEGSILIDQSWMELAGILPYELVHVWNRTNGSRHITYAIPTTPGSGDIISNGPAAFMVDKGDILIIAAFTQLEEAKAHHFKPKIVLFDKDYNPYLKQV